MAYVGIFHAALPAAVNLTPTITVLDPINDVDGTDGTGWRMIKGVL